MALEDLYKAIEEKRLVQFMYTNQKGETTLRTCESYEIKQGKFFGFDLAKDQIRQFFIAMMEDVKILDVRFIPRF